MGKTYKGSDKDKLKDKYIRERELKQTKRHLQEEKKVDKRSDEE